MPPPPPTPPPPPPPPPPTRAMDLANCMRDTAVRMGVPPLPLLATLSLQSSKGPSVAPL